MAEFCFVDYGSHIGEYIKYRLEAQGRSQAWLAREINTSKQNFYGNWLSKSELMPSQLYKLEQVLGEEFFQEFFEKNPELNQIYHKTIPGEVFASKSEDLDLPEKQVPGFSIKIEIDPLNFNPDHALKLGSSLRKALEDFKKSIGVDKK